jgi:hypothetical protein
MCASKKYVFFNLVGKRYGHLRRPRGSRGGYKHKKPRNIINELDATVRTPEAAAGGEAVARGADVRNTPQWNGRNNAWAEWNARDNSRAGWSSSGWRRQ